ncbi:beta-1-syntrophin [Nilaparvata lugens]|uniref:beta-1-syntrophin n=1 Tax=Nilaparvata lugens TaxID=108931 RepID=UPI00193D2AF4|nr:beta-1-syntrophin [Nilaparvata lugens]
MKLVEKVSSDERSTVQNNDKGPYTCAFTISNIIIALLCCVCFCNVFVVVVACSCCLLHVLVCATDGVVVTWLYVTVKYLREVRPYFRKASIISEVGWELQRGFLSQAPPSPGPSPPRADTRYLPLQLCHLARNLAHLDPENRTIELHSPDGVHSCVLRAADPTEAGVWFNTLHSALHALAARALLHANRLLAALLGQLQHIGWLARRPHIENGRASSESSEELERWQPVFGAITQRELRLYESAPWSPEAWTTPLEVCPLISTRLVSSSRQTDVIVFSVRCGTGEGVVTHQLRAETHRDLANWARMLVQGCHNSVQLQQQLACRCSWKGQPCQLVLNYEDGFTLYEAAPSGMSRNESKKLWSFPFERLKTSADDGQRLLWLDFGGDESDIELDMECCPKPIVFILHNFLSAKIHRLESQICCASEITNVNKSSSQL